ncbi:MAG: endolytic transglycosylase MltG [Bdellovibrionaceae bacterium]|nr:endolytic transglycosylase MltG [Pseudobdellovibrionaceae bacterium]
MKAAVWLSALLFMAALGGGGWYVWNGFVNSPATSLSTEVVYEVRPGLTLTRVAHDLEDKRIVRNADWFLLLARFRGQQNAMKVGEYLLTLNMKPTEVLEVITSGRSLGRNFTVSEGLNIFEIADIYGKAGFGSKAEFWKWVTDADFASSLVGERVTSLEGYLFPETYQITKYTDTKSVIRAMVARFLDTYMRDVQPIALDSGMTRHQIVTLASIIEKETGAPEERPRISSVFHNRLRKGMMLQTDPTVLYGKARAAGVFELSITRKDLTTPTEYNTYVIKGLPPGPIANPGRAALLAALRPESTDYLFFVSQNDGTHIFTKTYQEHFRAVQDFQVNRKAREGRSWRELGQKRTGENLQKSKD